MTESDKAREWLQTQVHCCGYPKCDGDLIATPHSSACPLFRKDTPTLIDRLAAYGAAQYEAGAASERRKCRRDPETGEYTDNYGD